MLIEYRRDIILRGGLAADPVALGAGVGKATAHTSTQDRQFQFGEHRAHLDEGLRHWVNLAVAAIDCNGADNHQPQVLFLDGVEVPLVPLEEELLLPLAPSAPSCAIICQEVPS